MFRVYCILIGYVFGLFQTAFFYGKLHGIDIREHGSGNAGTTNTIRVLGTKAGLIVFAGDVLKCMLAILVTWLIFGRTGVGSVYLVKIYTAAGTILGHNFPFYMKFKGGKGIASTAGFILSFNPWFIPVGMVMFFGAFLITHYVSLGALLIYVGFMVQLILMGQFGCFGMTQPELTELYLVGLFLAVMAFLRHRQNIVRLAKGCEKKTYLFINKKGENPNI